MPGNVLQQAPPGSKARIGKAKRDPRFLRSFTRDFTNTPLQWGTRLAPTILVVNSPDQGTAEWQRISDEIEMEGLKLRFHVQIKPTINATNPEIFARFFLVYDRQWSAKNPTTWGATSFDTLLSYNLSGGIGQADTLAFQNPSYITRYKILRDYQFYLSGYVVAGGVDARTDVVDNATSYFVEDYVPLKGKVTEWSSNAFGETGQGIQTGCLFLFAYGENAVGAVHASQIVGTTELLYWGNNSNG